MAQGEKPDGVGAHVQKTILKYLKVKKIEEELKAAKKEYEEARAHTLDVFTAQGISAIDYRGFNAHLHQQDHGSLVKDEQGTNEGAFKALRKQGLGWMIKEKVEPSTLSAWVREQPEDDQKMERVIPEALQPWVQVYRKKEIRIKKKP